MSARRLLTPVRTVKRGFSAAKPSVNASTPATISSGKVKSVGLAQRTAGLALVGVAATAGIALKSKDDASFRSTVDDYLAKITGRKTAEVKVSPPPPKKDSVAPPKESAGDKAVNAEEKAVKVPEEVAEKMSEKTAATTAKVAEKAVGVVKKADEETPATVAAVKAEADATAIAQEVAAMVKSAESDAEAAAAAAAAAAAEKEEEAKAAVASKALEPTAGKPIRAARSEADSLASLHAELKELDEAAAQQRFASIDGVLKDIEVRERALRSEVDAHLGPHNGSSGGSGGGGSGETIEALSDAELRTSIHRLAAEMEMRAKWEALRLGHLMAHVEEGAAKQSQLQIGERQVRADAALAHELARVKIDSENRAALELQKLEREAGKRRTEQLASQHAEMKAQYEAKLKGELDAKREEMRSSLEAELTAMAFAAASDEQVRCGATKESASQVKELEAMRSRLQAFKHDSAHAQRLSGAIAGLGLALRSGKPLAKEASAVAALAKSSFSSSGSKDADALLVEQAALSLVKAGASQGFPTVRQLRASFEGPVKRAAAQAAFAQAGADGSKAPGAGGYLLGWARAKLWTNLPPLPLPSVVPRVLGAADWVGAVAKGQGEEKGGAAAAVQNAAAAVKRETAAEEALAAVSCRLSANDLKGAVAALGKLEASGNTAAARAVQDWIADAHARLAADQTSLLLHAHGSVLNGRFVS